MEIFLRPEDQNRIASQIKKELQELMDRLDTPGSISSSEKERAIKDISLVTSRIDLVDTLPSSLMVFAKHHHIIFISQGVM